MASIYDYKVKKRDGGELDLADLKGKVLVKFYADWCGPCQMMKPIVEELAEKHEEIKVLEINIDDEDELAEKYRVETIPCLVLLEDGKEIAREVGVMPLKKLEKLIEK